MTKYKLQVRDKHKKGVWVTVTMPITATKQDLENKKQEMEKIYYFADYRIVSRSYAKRNKS
jgi:hypothetical protein